MTDTIQQIRKRAWEIANNSIKYINAFNDALYEGFKERPPKIPELGKEEENNISIGYIQSLVKIAKENTKDLKKSLSMINYINDKNNECKLKINKLKG